MKQAIIMFCLILGTSQFALCEEKANPLQPIKIEDIWIDEEGVPHIDPIAPYFNDVLSGKILAPNTKTLLAQKFPGIKEFTDSDLSKIRETFNEAKTGTIFFLTSIKTLTNSSGQTTADGAATDGNWGSLTGNVYKIKRLTGEDFIEPSDDFIYLFPVSSEFFSKLIRQDVAAAKKQFIEDVKVELKKKLDAGDKSCESALALIEIGSVLPQGTTGATVYRDILNEYTHKGKFNQYNLRQIMDELIATDSKKQLVKAQPNNVGKFTFEKVATGFYCVYYSQRVMDYLYVIPIQANTESSLNIFRAFDHRPFTELQ